MVMKKILCIALFSILVILPAAGAQAATWYVDRGAVTSGDGTSWAEAFQAINQALAAAASTGDEIWVADGTYDEGTLTISKVVDLYGGFNGTETSRSQRNWETNVTTIDGEDTIYHCLQINSGAGGTIDGFTITGGNADGGASPDNRGGGIFIYQSAALTIAHCTFTGNSADYGGGAIFASNVYGEVVTISECTFTGNSADNGGAFGLQEGNPAITNCTFSGNSAGSGGAIFHDWGALPIITGCTFAGNDATSYGGAIFNKDPSSSPIITNCTFSGNTASSGGGAILNSQATATITNCTFTGNEATGGSGGAVAGMASSTTTITNCILWGDSATSSGDEIYNTGLTITVNYSDVEGGYGGTSNIDTDPFFKDITDPDAANWDLHLQLSSPCIDQGNNAAPEIPDYDFEGEPRIYDGDADGTATVDMGADEVYFFPQCVATPAELQAALETAETNGSHDLIQVVQGLYYGHFTYDSNEGRNITLEGGYTAGCAARVRDPANTVLDGYNAGTVLYLYSVAGGDVTVDGFTIQHGAASGDGGGVSVISYPGVTVHTGGITLTGNIITGNTASGDGGGVYANTWTDTGEVGDIIISDNNIFGNDGGFGGGVRAFSTSDSGTAGTVTCTNNTIFGNDANYGGGVEAHSSSNTGTAGTVTLTNNTITGNNANYGGGAYLFLTAPSGGTIDCYNNIIWGNTASSGGDILLSGTGTRYGYNNDYTSIDGTWNYQGGPNIDADPFFVDAGAGDYHLQTTSPCIDAGTGSAPELPGTDFEGEPRSMDGDHDGKLLPDMGVDEVPTIWYVDGDVSSSGTGTNWGETYAFKYIGEAMTAASAGDEIWVKQGTYVIPSTITVNKAVGLYGGFAGTETARSQRDWETNTTTVDGDDSVQCFSVTDDAVVDGFTITQGYHASSNGAGMYISASPSIINCTFTDNNAGGSSASGGAIYIYISESLPTIENCTFSNNTATSIGGAIYNYFSTGSGGSTIANCTFSATNTAGYGGAIGTVNADITISDCTFSGNTATSTGGALYNGSGTRGTIRDCTFSGNTATTPHNGGGMTNAGTSTLTISDCTFQGNSAWRGGGMDNTSCSPTITRCTFTGNTCDYDANGGGGGMLNENATPTITNCLFYNNSVTYLGGGIFNYSNSHATITNCTFYNNTSDVYGGAVANTLSNPTFTNCILWGDTATTSGNEIYVLSGSPTFTYSDIAGGYTGTGNIDANPLFVNVTDPDPANWDLHLKLNSPCIDQGNNAAPSLPATDFEGDARIINGTVDMGADEAAIIPVSGSSSRLCPDGLGFGEVATSSTRNLNLIMNNTTDANIDVDPITVVPSPPYTKTADNCGGVTLHPGDTCSITIQFAPSSTGTFYGSFDITTDDPEAGTITVALSGIGVTGGSFETRGSSVSGPGAIPDVIVTGTGDSTPASPPVVEGSSSTSSNTGTTSAGELESPSVDTGTTNSSASSVVISSLRPDMPKEPEKQLLLAEELEPYDAMIFGEIQVGASDQLRITFSHEQGAVIHMGDIILPNAPYVIVEDKCSGALLGTGGECAVTVQFAPPTAENFYGYFLIPTDDPEVGTLRINLEGTGVSK
jgi:predicted outer membrane repeat protein